MSADNRSSQDSVSNVSISTTRAPQPLVSGTFKVVVTVVIILGVITGAALWYYPTTIDYSKVAKATQPIKRTSPVLPPSDTPPVPTSTTVPSAN